MYSAGKFEERRQEENGNVISQGFLSAEFLPSPDHSRLITASASPDFYTKYLMKGGDPRPVDPYSHNVNAIGRRTFYVEETLVEVVKALSLGLVYSQLKAGEFDETKHKESLDQLRLLDLGSCSAETVEVYDQVVYNIETRLRYWSEDGVMNPRVRLSRLEEEELARADLLLPGDWEVQDLLVEAVWELCLDYYHTFFMPLKSGAPRWLRTLEQVRPLAGPATRYHLDRVMVRIQYLIDYGD
jgi:hypothetical protein